MQVTRSLPILAAALVAATACSGPSKKEIIAESTLRADSLFYLRNELLEQVMEGTRFVNEINAELAKARSINLGAARQLKPGAELADANDERRQVVSRITKLVERLDAVQGRLAGMRKEVADKDALLKSRIAEYEQMVASVNHAAEVQRAELQAIIDGQATTIMALTGQVDTLTGALGQLTAEHNTVYVVTGTREELVEKGVLVPEGRKRFLLAGSRRVAPSRELDPAVFTKLDLRTDTTIILPDGEYRVMSRHNTAHVTTEVTKKGRITGAVSIDEPGKFWNGSKFLILMKS